MAILSKIKNSLVQAFISSVNTDKLYLFAARVTPYADENTPDPVTLDDDSSHYDIQREMLFGVRLANTDVVPMVAKYEWANGTVYDIYDDKDTELDSKEFFVVTSERKVFKCIDNSNGANSTVEPANTVLTGLPATLADGYRWQYMYTISESDMLKFETAGYIPAFENANVVANAISGAIFHMVVETPGSDYPNHTGAITLLMNGAGGTANLSYLQIANSASESNGYYNNCAITVITGSNDVTVREILTHYSNSTGRYVATKIPFANTDIANNFTYYIAPHIVTESYGQTSNVVARAVMNSNTGGLTSVEIIEPGAGYLWADVSVQTSEGFGSGADVRAIISPPGGHGSDVHAELFCGSVGFGVEFSNTVSFGHPSEVTYRTLGIIKNPLDAANTSNIFNDTHFNQVTRIVAANNSAATYDPGETIEANSSEKRVIVAFANTSMVITTGDDGSYLGSDTLLNSLNTGTQYSLTSISATPDLEPFTGTILFIKNTTPIERAQTSSENIKLVISL